MSIKARFLIKRGDFDLDVDLDIPARGVTALFGPSGCGKTTLLRAIAGLESNAIGELVVDGSIWQSGNRFLPPHKRPVGYVFQEPSLFEHLTVRRNLEFGMKRLGKDEQKVSLRSAVDLLGLEPLLDRRPHQLSGGEQQRVAIARALAVSPALLLLDEPLAALDEDLKREILPYLESLHRELEIPVIYVSHSRDEVARLADTLVILGKGQVQATGTVVDIFSRLDLALAHEPDTETVIETTVAGHDEQFELTYLDFSGGRFVVTRNNLELGCSVRLQIKASDVSVTLERQEKTSILNIFPASVDEVSHSGKARSTVRMLIGAVPILARVTRKSAVELGLKPGKKVFVQVKSIAVLS